MPGCTIGYEHTFINGFADFLASLEGGPAFHPNMREALRTQRVCDAVLEAETRAVGRDSRLIEAACGFAKIARAVNPLGETACVVV